MRRRKRRRHIKEHKGRTKNSRLVGPNEAV